MFLEVQPLTERTILKSLLKIANNNWGDRCYHRAPASQPQLTDPCSGNDSIDDIEQDSVGTVDCC